MTGIDKSSERCCVHVEKDRAKDRALGYATGEGIRKTLFQGSVMRGEGGAK